MVVALVGTIPERNRAGTYLPYCTAPGADPGSISIGLAVWNDIFRI
jgi:hypothetical protein